MRRAATDILRAGFEEGVDVMPKIEHVVVLMLENRSFDQMLGCLKQVHPTLEGIPSPAQRARMRGRTARCT